MAQKRKVDYSFLFMRAEGNQLRQITALVESGIIHPVVDQVFPFEKVPEAMAYVESGRTKGKVVIKVKYKTIKFSQVGFDRCQLFQTK